MRRLAALLLITAPAFGSAGAPAFADVPPDRKPHIAVQITAKTACATRKDRRATAGMKRQMFEEQIL